VRLPSVPCYCLGKILTKAKALASCRIKNKTELNKEQLAMALALLRSRANLRFSGVASQAARAVSTKALDPKKVGQRCSERIRFDLCMLLTQNPHQSLQTAVVLIEYQVRPNPP
jgi:hypothetical protein